MDIDCEPDYEGCLITNGEEILESVGFSEVRNTLKSQMLERNQPLKLISLLFQSKFGFDFGMLVVLCFVFRMLGFFAILFRSKRKVN